MPNYRRSRIEGGCYFFTVNLLERHQNRLFVEQIKLLRNVVKQVRSKHPFHIDAWVILPEHMHCIWTLPKSDADYALRMRLIKSLFAKRLPKTERSSIVRQRKGERGIWQRRFWEHTIRDENDYERHMDYVHFNPVKHGHVERVLDWPYSTFQHHVQLGVYSENWGVEDFDIPAGEPG